MKTLDGKTWNVRVVQYPTTEGGLVWVEHDVILHFGILIIARQKRIKYSNKLGIEVLEKNRQYVNIIWNGPFRSTQANFPLEYL